MPRRFSCIVLLLAATLLLVPAAAHSRQSRIAVLPMEDLSRGGNGLNYGVTQLVMDNLAARDLAVLDQDEVLAFMVKNRVRWLGHLGSRYIRRLHDDLEVDYALLGSVNQRRDSKPYVLGLTLQLIRTADARLVWARSVELCDADEIGLLGLAGSQDLQEMERLVVGKALQSLAADPRHYGGPLDIQEGVDSVFLEPEIVRPGAEVSCRITLNMSSSRLYNTTVSVFVDERIIEARYSRVDNSFLASWQAAAADGRYPVQVAISRPGQLDKEVLVGGYQVDGLAPKPALQVKGQELGGVVVLRKKIDMIPLLQNPEPISRWRMSVRDEKGAVVMGDDGRAGLPGRFSWWGQAKSGALVPDGFYTIELEVWDRVGNRGAARQTIQVIRQEPEMQVALNELDDKMVVNLNYAGKIPLDYWHLEIRDKEGEVISESSGTEAPDGLEFALAAMPQGKISYHLYAQDMLGNRLTRQIDAMVPLAGEASEGGDFLADAEAVTEESSKVMARQVWTEDF